MKHPTKASPQGSASSAGAGRGPALRRRTRLSLALAATLSLAACGAVLTAAPAPAAAEPCSNEALRTGPSAALPDCRAYEQVSPMNKDGGDVVGVLSLVQASFAGDRITFLAPTGMPGAVGESEFPLFIAGRGASGWQSQGLLPLTERGDTAGVLGWSEDLSQAVLKATLPGEPGQGIYLRDSATASFRLALPPPAGAEAVAGFSADDSHLIFETREQLLPAAAPGVSNLYEYDLQTGQLSLAGVLPDAECEALSLPPGCAPPGGDFAGPYEWEHADTTRGGAAHNFYTQSAISADGRRVFFTVAGSGQLYVRQDGTETIRVSAPQRAVPDPHGPQPAAFMTANSDGSQVFFTSHEELTEEANTGSADQGADLYDFNVQTGELADLSADSEAPGGAEVQGVLGASADGSYLYFVANGALAAGASPGTCRREFDEPEGTCNLYLYHEGTTTFIARLGIGKEQLDNQPTTDEVDWISRTNNFYLKVSRVSPDGRSLLFRSNQRLTAYDNQSVPEFYRYDAAANAGNGESLCVSCNPAGAAPSGAGPALLNYPEQVSPEGPTNLLTRNLSADGSRVFFETSEALLPADTNSQQDVYQWEAPGHGSCAESSPAFSEADGGCLYLISAGTGPNPSYFADADREGENAFFFTRQPLVGQDLDQLVDLYDARSGGGIAAQNQSPVSICAAEACRGPLPPAPSSQSPGSFTFESPGNEPAKPCRKGFVKKHGTCVRKHRPKKHRRRSQRRAAGRNRGGSR